MYDETDPKVERTPDREYVMFLNEADLLFVTEALANTCVRLRNDLNKVNFGAEAPRKAISNEGTEYTVEWTDEDAMFLANSIARLSKILFDARFLIGNPDHRTA